MMWWMICTGKEASYQFNVAHKLSLCNTLTVSVFLWFYVVSSVAVCNSLILSKSWLKWMSFQCSMANVCNNLMHLGIPVYSGHFSWNIYCILEQNMHEYMQYTTHMYCTCQLCKHANILPIIFHICKVGDAFMCSKTNDMQICAKYTLYDVVTCSHPSALL